MRVLAVMMVVSSCLAAPPVAERLLMVKAVIAMFETIGADMQHHGPIKSVALLVGASSGVVTVARLSSFLLHLCFLLPCLSRGLVWEPQELGLNGFLLSQQELGGPDGISGGCILPLELLIFHHKQNLFVC